MRNEDLIGQVVGGCRVVALLASTGAQGLLFRALDLEQESIPVALKVIVASAADNALALQRFHREATIARLVEAHANVVRIYRAGRDEALGIPYIVMELLEGEDVRAWLAKQQAVGGPSADVARDVLVQAARGVAALHRSRAGVVHRDLKPGNLYLHRQDDRRLRVKVLDFGAARVLRPTAGISDLTQVDGHAPLTPAYASPEQNAGRSDVGPEADVFSLGVIGYELFSGRRPYTPLQEQAMQRGGSPTLEPLGARVPPEVRRGIERALSPRAERRYPDARAFLEALEGTVVAPPPSSVEPLVRRAAVVLALVLLTYLAAPSLIRAIRRSDPPPSHTSPAPTEPRRYAQVSADGDSHLCALTAAGSALCWGENDHGEAGGTAPRVAAPQPVDDTLRFRTVQAGSHFTCGLDHRGQVYCWGDNSRGQLGSATPPTAAAPRHVSLDGRFAFVSVGRDHACAGTAASVWYCWGSNAAGQLGALTVAGYHDPLRVPGTFREMEAGDGFTCALDLDGHISCWGENGRGQLGDGGVTARAYPRPVAGGHAYQELRVGPRQACGRTVRGDWLCWGDNENGLLQVGMDGGYQPSPAPVVGARRWTELAFGARHGCALDLSGAVECWGGNGSDELGSTGGAALRPRPVEGGHRFARLSVGEGRSCGVSTGGELYCWGDVPGSRARGAGHSSPARIE